MLSRSLTLRQPAAWRRCSARRRSAWLCSLAYCFSLCATNVALAAPSETLRAGFPAARTLLPYSGEQIGAIVANMLGRATPPPLGHPVELTPDAPWSADGARLSVWKPSFVLGTAEGGEIGINFWNLYDGGHVNVGFTTSAGTATLLDCRVYSADQLTYKIYVGDKGELGSEGDSKPNAGHLLLLVPGKVAGPTSVQLWPSPVNSLLALTGCTLWPIPPP